MINILIWSALIALPWMMLTGYIGVDSFAIGVMIGFVIVALVNRTRPGTLGKHGLQRMGWLIRFLALVTRDTVIADLDVARRILSPRLALDPGMVDVPVGSGSTIVTAMSANAITITPGTLVVDFDEEQQTMRVHCLDMSEQPAMLAAEQEVRTRHLRRIVDDE